MKALTLLSLQTLVGGTRSEEIEYALMVKHFSYVEIFMDYHGFMIGYALTFILVGIAIGYFLKNATQRGSCPKFFSGQPQKSEST